MPDAPPGGQPGPGAVPDLAVASYLESRSLADDALVRAAFDDLRERVRAEVTPPSVRGVVHRGRRISTRSALSRLAVAAAAAALVAGAAVTLVNRGPAGDDATTVAAQGPTLSPAPLARPGTPAPTRPKLPTAAPTTAPRTRPVSTRTPAPADPDPRDAPRPPTAPPPSPVTQLPDPPPPGPSTEVTVYLWQDSGYPGCLAQYPVRRRVDGTGGWTASLQATLAGATADEQAQGYTSPFGPGVQVQVDEGTHIVNFTSRAVIADVTTACRPSLEQLIGRTAQDAGSAADVRIEGSALLWLNWELGLG